MAIGISDEVRAEWEEHIRKYPPRPEDYEAAEYFDGHSGDEKRMHSVFLENMLKQFPKE